MGKGRRKVHKNDFFLFYSLIVYESIFFPNSYDLPTVKDPPASKDLKYESIFSPNSYDLLTLVSRREVDKSQHAM